MRATSCISVVLFVVSVSVPAHAQLLHHFDLDEESGLVASDRNCGGSGTLVGFENDDDAQWVEGQFGGALDLGADFSLDNRVAVDLLATNGGEAGFTVAMWINPGEQINTLGEYQLLATPGDVVGFTIMNEDLELRHDRVLLFWDGNLPNLHVGTTTLESDAWYHVAITSTGIGGEKLYYVDGELEEQVLLRPSQGGVEGDHPANVDGWAAGAGSIGALGAAGRAHDTVIDDVRIFDSALTEGEIAALMDDEPLSAPAILNIFPESGELQHSAADGLAFDVETRAAGATLADDDIKLFLNGEDVSAALSFGGSNTAREVEYTGLEADNAYGVRIEVTDSNGSKACHAFTFATLETVLDGLVHHFRLNETSGLTALDLGSARNGTLVGFEAADDTQWVQGICDNGLDLGADATINNYVEFQSLPVSALETGGFTIAMWLKPGEQILTLGEFQLLSTPGDTIGFTIMNEDGELRHDRVLLFWDGSLPNLHVGTTTLEPGVWTHVAITSTGVGGEKLYYVNGELEEQTLLRPSQGGVEGEHPGNVDGWFEGIARLGAFGAGARAHDSTLDDVRIYDRALEEDEIFDVLNECDPLICDALELADLSPVDGEAFHDAAAGIEFEVSTPNAGFEIAADGIVLVLNGVDVSGDLVVGGTPTVRSVRYQGLQPDRAYTAELSVTDGCASLDRAIDFGTFTQCAEAGEEGLVHYWKLDETSGFSALDCVGGSIGSLSGIDIDDDSQWTDGVVGGALDFGNDGTLNNILAASVEGVDAVATGGYTVAMWINPGEQINNPGEYQLFSAPGGGVGFTIMNGTHGGTVNERVLLHWDGLYANITVTEEQLEPGAWYHVAVTSTGAGGERRLYIDGEPAAQRLLDPSADGVEEGVADAWPAGLAYFGAIPLARNHDSVFDEVRIYERALDPDDIAALAGDAPEMTFRRGDPDNSGGGNITDAIAVLNHLFAGTEQPACWAAADANGDGSVNVADPVFHLNFLFGGGSPPPAPGPETCGPGTATDETLGCQEYTSC